MLQYSMRIKCVSFKEKDMPNIKSAKKRVLVSIKKKEQNKMIKSEIKTAIKKYRAAISEKNISLAEQLLPQTVSLIDSAASKGIYHKKNASNKQANLSRALYQLKTAQQ